MGLNCRLIVSVRSAFSNHCCRSLLRGFALELCEPRAILESVFRCLGYSLRIRAARPMQTKRLITPRRALQKALVLWIKEVLAHLSVAVSGAPQTNHHRSPAAGSAEPVAPVLQAGPARTRPAALKSPGEAPRLELQHCRLGGCEPSPAIRGPVRADCSWLEIRLPEPVRGSAAASVPGRAAAHRAGIG